MTRTDDAVRSRLDAKVFSLYALHKAAQLLTSMLDLAALCEMAVDVETEMGGAASGALYLAAGPGEPFGLAAAKSLRGEPFPSRLGSDDPLIQAVQDAGSRPFPMRVASVAGEALIVPLRLREQLVGCFVLLDRMNAGPWGEDDGAVLETLASQVAVCVQNARLYQQLTEQYEALKAAQAQLVQAEKLATMGSLLAGVAHELNNPLSIVLGRAVLLRDKLAGTPVEAQAGRIAQAAERCARIVKNFLALARQHPPERQRVSLNRVVEEAIELLAYPLRVDSIEVVLDLATDLPPLWADPHQLQQVVVNLISNAHHALRGTAPPRRITFSSRVDRAVPRVHLEVADTGPGIAAEIQARIFEAFFTTKPPGQGTGLGLSLCQGFIEQHGGRLQVKSRPGQGAVFQIELPVTSAPPATEEAGTGDVAGPVRGRTILVVDDEPEIATLMADMLTGDGHQVETASDGLIALHKIRDREYDLILSDLRMPGLDGPGLWREMERRHPRLLRRVIFVTGDTLGGEMTEFLERSGAPRVAKPFSVDEVRHAVRQALRRR